MSAPGSPSKDYRFEDTSERVSARKNKGFKKIAGILTGSSRKERKAQKAAAQAAGKKTTIDDDAATVYGVNVEDRSLASRKSAASKDSTGKTYILKVVLLLMDPKTRRFELLQLEFDSVKALVSDILAQIPVSVTEEVLRQQTYHAVCGSDGVEKGSKTLLSTFCSGNDVLVAVSKGVKAKECARLAKPILCDTKVVGMLKNSGISTDSWAGKTRGPFSRKSPSSKSSSAPPAMNDASFLVFYVLLASILLQVGHLYISAPIKAGHLVSPGIYLAKCGILSVVPKFENEYLANLPSCENEYVTVSKEGTVSVFDDDDEMVWQMKGGACAEDDEECVAGMQVSEDNKIIIGGKTVKTVTMFKESELSPWPFAEKPSIRVAKKYR